MSFVARMPRKEGTGIVRENTRNAFAERAKLEATFFLAPFITPQLFSPMGETTSELKFT